MLLIYLKAMSLVTVIKVSTICFTILFILWKGYHLISPIDYFTVKYAVSLGVLIMTGSYWLKCGVLFVLVSVAFSNSPENRYLRTYISTLVV